jgi:hypothetical protein
VHALHFRFRPTTIPLTLSVVSVAGETILMAVMPFGISNIEMGFFWTDKRLTDVSILAGDGQHSFGGLDVGPLGYVSVATTNPYTHLSSHFFEIESVLVQTDETWASPWPANGNASEWSGFAGQVVRGDAKTVNGLFEDFEAENWPQSFAALFLFCFHQKSRKLPVAVRLSVSGDVLPVED